MPITVDVSKATFVIDTLFDRAVSGDPELLRKSDVSDKAFVAGGNAVLAALMQQGALSSQQASELALRRHPVECDDCEKDCEECATRIDNLEPLPVETLPERDILIRRGGYVLARWVRCSRIEYVTWKEYQYDDGRPTICEYGHYFHRYADAYADFQKRVKVATGTPCPKCGRSL